MKRTQFFGRHLVRNAGLYCCRTDDFKILPQKFTPETLKINLPDAVRVTHDDLKAFACGTSTISDLPINIYFYADEKPTRIDGLPHEVFCWNINGVSVQVVAYSLNGGIDVYVLDNKLKEECSASPRAQK